MKYASPATISRCGIIFCPGENLGFQPYFVRWVKQRCTSKGRSVEAAHFNDLFDKYVPRLVAYVLEGDLGRGDGEAEVPLATLIPVSALGMVKQLCALLDATLTGDAEFDDFDVLEGHFIFALTWSLGAAVIGNDRIRFNSFLQVKINCSVMVLNN